MYYSVPVYRGAAEYHWTFPSTTSVARCNALSLGTVAVRAQVLHARYTIELLPLGKLIVYIKMYDHLCWQCLVTIDVYGSEIASHSGWLAMRARTHFYSGAVTRYE